MASLLNAVTHTQMSGLLTQPTVTLGSNEQKALSQQTGAKLASIEVHLKRIDLWAAVLELSILKL
jgi:hypothetical protein